MNKSSDYYRNNRKPGLTAIVALAAVVAVLGTARANPIVYEFKAETDPGLFRDTRIESNNADTNRGDAGVMVMRINPTNPPGVMNRSLLKVDVSSIPSHMVVTNVNLTLHFNNVNETESLDFSIHRMLVDWEEMEATWNERAEDTAWGAAGMLAGTDYESTPLGTFTVSVQGLGPEPLNLSSALALSTVQGWVDGTYDNFGFALIPTDGVNSENPTVAQYNIPSREFSGVASRPSLEVTAIPEPSSAGLLIGAFVFGIAALRRMRRI